MLQPWRRGRAQGREERAWPASKIDTVIRSDEPRNVVIQVNRLMDKELRTRHG